MSVRVHIIAVLVGTASGIVLALPLFLSSFPNSNTEETPVSDSIERAAGILGLPRKSEEENKRVYLRLAHIVEEQAKRIKALEEKK